MREGTENEKGQHRGGAEYMQNMLERSKCFKCEIFSIQIYVHFFSWNCAQTKRYIHFMSEKKPWWNVLDQNQQRCNTVWKKMADTSFKSFNFATRSGIAIYKFMCISFHGIVLGQNDTYNVWKETMMKCVESGSAALQHGLKENGWHLF